MTDPAAILQTIAQLETAGRLAEAFARAVEQLQSASFTIRAPVWETFFLRSGNLAWAYGQRAFRPKGSATAADQCRLAVESLLNQQVAGFLRATARRGQAINETLALLKGMVRTIQAAAGRKLNLPEQQHYEAEAAEAYQQAFKDLGDPGLGQAIVTDVVERLTRHPPRAGAATWILLAGEARNQARAARLVVELVPGQTARLLPNPVAQGLLVLEKDFLETLKRAWEFVVPRWPCPAGKQFRCGLEGPAGVAQVSGDSGGAAKAAALRAAVEGVKLDPAMAISATLAPDGHLGWVEGGLAKREAAWEAGCDRVLFCPRTAREARANLTDEEADSRVGEATTFDQAFDELLAMHRHTTNYRNKVVSDWDKKWDTSGS